MSHNEGQDGPDDFDRPQTVAAYSAVLSAVAWGVDFAVTAVMQIFDCIDLRYDNEYPDARLEEVREQIAFIRNAVQLVTESLSSGGAELSGELLSALRE